MQTEHFLVIFLDKAFHFLQKAHKYTLLRVFLAKNLHFLAHTYFFLIKKIF